MLNRMSLGEQLRFTGAIREGRPSIDRPRLTASIGKVLILAAISAATIAATLYATAAIDRLAPYLARILK